MRALAVALALLLFGAICSLAEHDLGDRSIAAPSLKQETMRISCCFNYISRPIPRRIISSAYMTSNSCERQAVVLVTKKGMSVCVDPAAHWVQAYLKHSKLLEY
ncbi:CCL3 protein, partial [Ptilonorhynchus violaceus]|nr:CCL3 protein [Ptilonorhynchus violaceus]